MLALLLAASAPLLASRLDQTRQLEREGKPLEASKLVQATIAELRQSGDHAELAQALSESSRIDISLGKYQEAIRAANEAIALRGKLRAAPESDDYNTLGLADLNLANYSEALENYRKALAIDRKNHDLEAEVIRLNNIANVHYFLGQYQDAYAAYQEAKDEVNASHGQPGSAMSRQGCCIRQAIRPLTSPTCSSRVAGSARCSQEAPSCWVRSRAPTCSVLTLPCTSRSRP